MASDMLPGPDVITTTASDTLPDPNVVTTMAPGTVPEPIVVATTAPGAVTDGVAGSAVATYSPFAPSRRLPLAPYRGERGRCGLETYLSLHTLPQKTAATTNAQTALAWLLAQKPWIVPIPGTTKLHRLEENLGATSIELTPDDLSEIDDATSKITVQGARYPENIEQMTGR
jgi:hypothetical protein